MKIRKVFLISLSVLMLGILSSCGGESGNKNEQANSEKEYTEVSSQEASVIIDYTNNLIDEIEKANSWLKSNRNNIHKMIETVQKEQKKFPIGTIILPYTGSGFKKDQEVPAALNKEYREFFTITMTDFRKKFNGMRENIASLKKYYEAEDYKDDKFAKGKLLADSISAALELLPDITTILYNKIDIVAEAAEKVILKDHPLKDPILAAKGDLADFEMLYEKFYEYSEGLIAVGELEEAYDNMASKVETHKNSYMELLQEEREYDSYQYYYKKFEDEALLNARKILRNAKEGKKVTDNDLDKLISANNSLVNAYNSFIN